MKLRDTVYYRRSREGGLIFNATDLTYARINDVSFEVLESIASGYDEVLIAKKLQEKYEVDYHTAVSDIRRVCKQLTALGILKND